MLAVLLFFSTADRLQETAFAAGATAAIPDN